MIRPIDNKDRALWFDAVFYPALIVAVLWAVFLLDNMNQWGLNYYGLRPGEMRGIVGIFTIPFLHSDLGHIAANTSTFIVLLWGLFYFYRKMAWKVLILIWLVHAGWMWLLGEPGPYPHVGASGVIYGLGFFLFISGVLRKRKELIALSLIMVFLYGSMIWGVLPNPTNPFISWQGHLSGAIAGLLFAFYFRKQGPQKNIYQWELDEIKEQEIPTAEDEFPYWMQGVNSSMDTNAKPLNIRYIYVPKTDIMDVGYTPNYPEEEKVADQIIDITPPNEEDDGIAPGEDDIRDMFTPKA